MAAGSPSVEIRATGAGRREAGPREAKSQPEGPLLHFRWQRLRLGVESGGGIWNHHLRESGLGFPFPLAALLSVFSRVELLCPPELW